VTTLWGLLFGARIPVGTRYFSDLKIVHTGSGAHPAPH